MSYPQDKEANLKMAKSFQMAEPTTQHLYNKIIIIINNNKNNNIHRIFIKVSSCVCKHNKSPYPRYQ